MRRGHPLWRGFWLACLWTATLVLLGGVDWLAPFRGDESPLILALATAAGASLVTLIRLLRGRASFVRPRPARMLVCFLSGAAMALALAMAGTGRILPALLEGSAGAFAFAGAAALSSFVAARLLPGEVDA